jgi:hypothetical protein
MLRIACRGVDVSERRRRYRWVAERIPAWLNRFRPLTVRYERREDIHLAFTTLGCALIGATQCKRFHCKFLIRACTLSIAYRKLAKLSWN